MNRRAFSDREANPLERVADGVEALGPRTGLRVREFVEPAIGQPQPEQVRDELLDFHEGLRAVAPQVFRHVPGIVDIAGRRVPVSRTEVQRPAEMAEAILGARGGEGVPHAARRAIEVPGAQILDLRDRAG